MISVPNDSSALSGLDPIAKRRRIAEGLWGLQLQSPSRVDQLRAYFEHFQDQAGQLNVSMDDVFTAAEILKESPDSTRQNLRNTITSALGHGRGIRNTTTSQIQRGNGASVPQDITTRDSVIEEIIVATLRVMLAVNINLDSRTVFLATPGLNWGESQSLTSFLNETFPKHAYDDEPHTPFMVSRLRARYLEDHADVQLEWTHHLPDHLMLNIGSQTKTLRVFDLVSLLEITYEVMKDEPWDTSVEDSLKRYVQKELTSCIQLTMKIKEDAAPQHSFMKLSRLFDCSSHPKTNNGSIEKSSSTPAGTAGEAMMSD